MANEINLTISLEVTKGAFRHSFRKSVQRDMAGSGGGNPGIVTVTSTGDVTVSFGDTTGNGIMYLTNLSTGATVDYGPASTGGTLTTFGTLLPQDPSILRIKGTASCILSTTSATADVQIGRFAQ